jgi:transposase
MQRPHDDSKACLTQDSTVTVVVEMSLKSWLVADMIPGVNREPLKKIALDPELLRQLLYRWRDEAIRAGKEITRIAVAYETGRDGFGWPVGCGLEASTRTSSMPPV